VGFVGLTLRKSSLATRNYKKPPRTNLSERCLHGNLVLLVRYVE